MCVCVCVCVVLFFTSIHKSWIRVGQRVGDTYLNIGSVKILFRLGFNTWKSMQFSQNLRNGKDRSYRAFESWCWEKKTFFHCCTLLNLVYVWSQLKCILRVWGYISVVEHMLSMCETQSSHQKIPNSVPKSGLSIDSPILDMLLVLPRGLCFSRTSVLIPEGFSGSLKLSNPNSS
jgi:hypothetical protein